MKIILEAIPQEAQRYDTTGDWFFDGDGNLRICVTGESILAPETFLVALHELVEVKLCHAKGISQKEVDVFDFSFKGEGEPGDDPKAPYRKEHREAMLIEALMAHFLGLMNHIEIK